MMKLQGYKVTSSENQLVIKFKKVTNEARKHKKDE
jgi:hypothetical protein